MAKPKLKILLLLLCFVFFGISKTKAQTTIDHISIVVNDLEQAKRDFKNLGFSIKPGRLHSNSLENFHIKFQDGTALEVITATKPEDDLATTYLKMKQDGDGPVFICFNMDNPDSLAQTLSEFQPTITSGSYFQWLTFPIGHPLYYLFFIQYTQQPTNIPAHLKHANTTLGIQSIRLSKTDFTEEESLFQQLNIKPDNKSLSNYQVDNRIITLQSSEKANNLRPIQQVTLLVADLNKALDQLPKALPFDYKPDNSVVLPKEYCHGIEITFVQK